MSLLGSVYMTAFHGQPLHAPTQLLKIFLQYLNNFLVILHFDLKVSFFVLVSERSPNVITVLVIFISHMFPHNLLIHDNFPVAHTKCASEKCTHSQHLHYSQNDHTGLRVFETPLA